MKHDHLTCAARLAHEANRAWCLYLGDESQPSWVDAPQWQRDSAAQGVKAVIDDPRITPEQLHIKWCQAKTDAGWIYGSVKDAEAKTHPCLLPYHRLPADQRAKDALFQNVVRTFLGLVGVIPPEFTPMVADG